MRILYVESVPSGLKIFLIVFLLIACIITVACSTNAWIDHKIKSAIISTAIFVVSLTGIVLVSTLMPEYLPNKYIYYVEVTDEENISELLKDYNILETYGSIYKIEDK